MQRTISIFIALVFTTVAFAQKTELRASINSGLFSFSGKSAENISSINFNKSTNSGYTNNPYGSKSGLCYGLSGNLKRVAKTNFIAGVDAGFENLRSKILINQINGYTGTSTSQINATGKTFLNYIFFNVYPYTGYRFNLQNLSFDIMGGMEVASCLKATEKGNARAENGTKYTTSVDRKTIHIDLRPAIQFSANYHKAGIYLGYSHGLANYLSGSMGGTNEIYARLIRFGLTYKIN